MSLCTYFSGYFHVVSNVSRPIVTAPINLKSLQVTLGDPQQLRQESTQETTLVVVAMAT